MIACEISGWTSKEDLEWLAARASEHDVIVEIGSYQGRSTRALGDSARGVVYAVDDWQGLRTVDKDWWEGQTPEEERATLFQRFRCNVSDLIESGKVRPVIANHAAVPRLPIADMVFIDGSHDYDSVKRDIETWLPRLTSGGLLCGHDFGQDHLMRAVNECLPGARRASECTLIWQWVKP